MVVAPMIRRSFLVTPTGATRIRCLDIIRARDAPHLQYDWKHEGRGEIALVVRCRCTPGSGMRGMFTVGCVTFLGNGEQIYEVWTKFLAWDRR